MGSSNYVHLEDCNIIQEGKEAFLVEYEDEQFWIPFSQIADVDDLEKGDQGVTVSITEWLAKKLGIEGD